MTLAKARAEASKAFKTAEEAVLAGGISTRTASMTFMNSAIRSR